jgi:hypothetical protein
MLIEQAAPPAGLAKSGADRSDGKRNNQLVCHLGPLVLVRLLV